MSTIHVIQGGSAAESLRDALAQAGRDEHVVGLLDDLAVGPLQGVDETPDTRAAFWQHVLGDQIPDWHAQIEAELARLDALAADSGQVVVWHAPSVGDKLLLRRVAYHLRNVPQRLNEVRMSPADLDAPARAALTRTDQACATGMFPPAAFARKRPVAAPISVLRIGRLALEWQEAKHLNAELRYWVSNTIKSGHYTDLDALILAHAEAGWPRATARRQHHGRRRPRRAVRQRFDRVVALPRTGGSRPPRAAGRRAGRPLFHAGARGSVRPLTSLHLLFRPLSHSTMARTRAPDHESQREQILDLAAEKFAQTSYPSTSMSDLATASGTSKARLYHYYESKEAILFDLLDRYTKRLMLIIAEVEGASQRRGLSERDAFAELVRAFLAEYETSHSRHVALLNDVKYLEDAQREIVLDRQRDIVAAFARQLARAYPDRISKENQTSVTMMVFGMINWTFTWLKPGGRLGYRDFAEQVIDLMERGLSGTA
jgi:AcrR family transcriptional regulator